MPRSPNQRANTNPAGPELVGEVLSRLFAARGWGRRQERLQLEEAWAVAVGVDHARQTRLGSIKRGILEVQVANAVLMQELAHFHKRRLLDELRRQLPRLSIRDLRFRAGTW
ncbi:MAG: DciA family protein [Gemmataceae bacterium]